LRLIFGLSNQCPQSGGQNPHLCYTSVPQLSVFFLNNDSSPCFAHHFTHPLTESIVPSFRQVARDLAAKAMQFVEKVTSSSPHSLSPLPKTTSPRRSSLVDLPKTGSPSPPRIGSPAGDQAAMSVFKGWAQMCSSVLSKVHRPAAYHTPTPTHSHMRRDAACMRAHIYCKRTVKRGFCKLWGPIVRMRSHRACCRDACRAQPGFIQRKRQRTKLKRY
jgi:hypothetical protein